MARLAADLFPAAARGDEQAREVVATLAHGIALAVQVLVVTGAELVVIGGGLARDRAELEQALAADITSRAQASPFLRRLDLVGRIRVLDGDVPVAAIGAALLPGSNEPVGVQTPDGGRRPDTPDATARRAAQAVLGCPRAVTGHPSSGWRRGPLPGPLP